MNTITNPFMCGAHQPVLLKEVIEYLAPKPGEIVIDGTIGLGGHSGLFLQKILPRGRLIGIDLDCQALALAQKRLLTCLPAGTAGGQIGSLDPVRSEHERENNTLIKSASSLSDASNGVDLFCDNFANIGDIIGKLGLKGAGPVRDRSSLPVPESRQTGKRDDRYSEKKILYSAKHPNKDILSATEPSVSNGVDVILLDLGVSSYQLDTPERGFSFMNDAPLDMRMSLAPQGEARLDRRPNNPVNASIVVNDYPEEELIRIFRSYGEERFAKRIAQRIVSSRSKEQITTTGQLVDIIKKAAPSGWQRIHPATRVFQALRIEVNKELDNLERFLIGFTQWLKPGGRVGIISFHSLEDRLVKRSFRKYKEEGILEIVTKKPVIPTAEEEKENPRSRSAKFRVAVKV